MQSIYSIQSRHFNSIVFLALAAALGACAFAEERPEVNWVTDYHAGLDQAEQRGTLALLWFFDPQTADADERFQKEVLDQPEICGLISEQFVAIKLPRDGKIMSGGEEMTLLDHSS